MSSFPTYCIASEAIILNRHTCVISIEPRQAFFQSLGSSNSIDFPGIYFPFRRVTESGTIYKCFSHEEQPWRKEVTALLNEELKFLDKKSRNFVHKIYDSFLSKMGCWQHVQISVCLSLADKENKSIWDRPDLSLLKKLALFLTWKWDKFVSDPDVVLRYNFSFGIPKVKISVPKYANIWLQEHKALQRLSNDYVFRMDPEKIQSKL